MKLYRILLSALFAISVWLLWWLKYPELLQFQEQNQLFLFSWSYLGERISVCGGLADYIAEFFTQFNLIPWLGALLVAAVLSGIQLTTWELGGSEEKTLWYPLSFISPALLLVYMGNQDVMLCFPVALLMALTLCIIYSRRPSVISALVMIAAGYWLAGAAIFLFALYVAFKDRKALSLLYIPYTILVVLLTRLSVMQQYPWRQLLLGLDYYRMPLAQPAMEVICTAAALIVPIIITFLPPVKKYIYAVSAVELASIATLGITGISISYKADKCEIIAWDQLVRQEKWKELLSRADKHQPKSEIACVGLNLSLFMDGRTDRLDEYWQAGHQGLIMPRVRDYISNSATCEVFWRLGFVNESLRYAFDTQESIPNLRKSGRWMCRMAECQIVNGRYSVAAKYLDILKQSLFYRKWAIEHEQYLNDEGAIYANKVYAYLRAVRNQEDYLYYYPEMDKMLGKLYLNNGNNTMAAWYYQAWKHLSQNEKVEDNSAGSVHGN